MRVHRSSRHYHRQGVQIGRCQQLLIICPKPLVMFFPLRVRPLLVGIVRQRLVQFLAPLAITTRLMFETPRFVPVAGSLFRPVPHPGKVPPRLNCCFTIRYRAAAPIRVSERQLRLNLCNYTLKFPIACTVTLGGVLYLVCVYESQRCSLVPRSIIVLLWPSYCTVFLRIMPCRRQHRLSPYIDNCFRVLSPLRNSSLLHCTPLRSLSSDTILLPPLFVNMSLTPSSQPTGRLSSIPVRARSTTCNVPRKTSVFTSCLFSQGPMTRSTVATLAAEASSERPRKRLAMR